MVSSIVEFGLAGTRNGRYAPHPFREFRVTSTAGFNSVALSGRSRFLAATVGGGLLALLVVASQLQPDPRGLGTHQQLGLPPCTFSMLFGQRCPACGMTTSWSLVTHGRVSEALNNHISGTVLAGLALTGGLTAVVAAARGKWFAWRPTERTVALAAVLLAGLIVGEWTIRLLTR